MKRATPFSLRAIAARGAFAKFSSHAAGAECANLAGGAVVLIDAFEVKSRPQLANLCWKGAPIMFGHTIAVIVAGFKFDAFAFDALLIGQALNPFRITFRRRIRELGRGAKASSYGQCGEHGGHQRNTKRRRHVVVLPPFLISFTALLRMDDPVCWEPRFLEHTDEE